MDRAQANPDPDTTRHVIVAKPEDVLLLGNIGTIDNADRIQALLKELRDLGITAFVFQGDIDIDLAQQHKAGA